MSNDKDRVPDVPNGPRLTNAQKDAARRMQMSEKEYAANVADLIKRGKIQREHIT